MEDSKYIQGVTSMEGELLKMYKANIAAKGEIEIWLKNIETCID